MAVRTGTRDPRTIITPDAFEVAPELLGMPLAQPRKRFVAMAIDLAVIGLITLMTNSFGLVLGVVAAAFFIRAGFKRTPVKGSAFDRAMRFSVGCLGMFIGVITAVLWVTVGPNFGSGAGADTPAFVAEGVVSGERLGAGRILAMAGAGLALSTTDDADEAETALRVLAATSHDLGLSRVQIRESLLDQLPEDAPWIDEAPGMITSILDEIAGGPESAEPDPDALALAEAVEALSPEEALREYAALVQADSSDPRRGALRARLAEDVAGETLSAQASQIADLEDEVRLAGLRLQAVSSSLEEATSGGIFGWLREFVDELGFGFGWASLYLTVMLSWWKGQTVGKKLMRIRVVRLDGEPITWWTAFERGGGYAAGFATGLLGFAQVYWDANRQGIHDHIVGTVVVIDGAEKIGNWEEAL